MVPVRRLLGILRRFQDVAFLQAMLYYENDTI